MKIRHLLFFTGLLLSAALWAQDPVVFLDFEGDANDESGNALNGTITGTVTFEEDAERGMVAVFAEDGYIKLPVDSKLDFGTDKDFTLTLWIKTSTTINSDPAILSSQDWNSGGNPGFGIYLQDDDDKGGGVREYWKFKCGGGAIDMDGHDCITNGWGDGFNSVVDDEWHMLAATGDRDGNISLYQDGTLRGETTFTVGGDPSADPIGDLSTPHPWVLMQHGAVEDIEVGPYGKDFAGSLDNVRIYDRVLSEQEISDLYTSPVGGGGEEGLIVDIPFIEDLNDDSGNDLHGTATGDVTFVSDADLGRNVAHFPEAAHMILPDEAKLDFGTDKDFTLSIWVKTTTTINSDPAIISSQDWNSGGNPGFGIYLQDDDDKGGGVKEYWKFKCGGGAIDMDGHDIITNGWGDGFETVVDGEWTMLTATGDRDGNISLYQDGVLKGQTTFTVGGDPGADPIGDLSTPNPWVIMQHGAVEDVEVGPYGKDFEAHLANLKIYDRVLSESEVLELWNAPTAIRDVTEAFEVGLYPNPVSNDNLNIRFSMKESGKVGIALYSYNGQEQEVISAKKYVAGDHEITFNTAHLETGLYLVVIKKDGFRKGMKLVVE
jgi:hypothetical protein